MSHDWDEMLKYRNEINEHGQTGSVWHGAKMGQNESELVCS